MRSHLYAGLVSLGALAGAAPPAHALTFSFTTYANDTLTAAESAAFSTAALAWSTVLTDRITINLQIGFASLGTSPTGGLILGSTQATVFAAPTSSVLGLLTADATSATDRMAVASLSTLSPTGNTELTTAQAKALGFVVGAGIDGIIQFSTDVTNFSDSRNADGTIANNTYDLIGIAEHEIGHVLGFQSSFDNTPSSGGSYGNPTLLDDFRFTSPGVRATSTGAAYYTLDDGATTIAGFATGGANQYQASHWLQGTGGLMDPAVAVNHVQNITQLDVTALDSIGYDVAVPEPGSLLLLGAAAAGLIARRRTRHAATDV